MDYSADFKKKWGSDGVCGRGEPLVLTSRIVSDVARLRLRDDAEPTRGLQIVQIVTRRRLSFPATEPATRWLLEQHKREIGHWPNHGKGDQHQQISREPVSVENAVSNSIQ